jgi:predicted kinase
VLIVFGGLPGVGKTTLAKAVARDLRAAYVRIDSIEHALGGTVGPEGYLVGYAVAESNLRLGLPVVADSVNPLAISREGWRGVAARCGVALAEIEVLCSDIAEHRRRVESRAADLPGFVLPTWAQVAGREYEAWDRPRCLVDTALRGEAEALADIRNYLHQPLE